MKGFNANKTEIIEGKTFLDCSQKSLVKKRITGKNYFIILIFLEKKKKLSKVGQINQFSFAKINTSLKNISEFTCQKVFITVLQNKTCTLLL